MTTGVKDLRLFVGSILQRLGQIFSDSNSRAVQVTGVLGLAAVIFGLYHLHGTNRKDAPRRGASARGTQNDGASTSGQTRGASTQEATQKLATPVAAKPAHLTGAQWAVKSKLAGMRTITVSALGVLLEEWTVDELEESARLRPDAAEVLREMASNTSVYLITQVKDDTGEATCRGALEAGGLVGSGPGQIPPQRLLFCSSLEGKASIVRQLEPQLHIDGHSRTIEDLKRFIKLVHIYHPGQQPAGRGSPNVGSAQSLAQLFS